MELLRQVAQQLQVEIEFTRAPWTRVLAMAKHSRVDAVFHAGYKSDRALYLAYPMKNGLPDQTKFVKRQRYFLYKLQGSNVYSKEGTVFNVDGEVGAVLDYAVVSQLKDQGLKVEEVDSAAKGLSLLSKGRLDAWVGLESINDLLLSEAPDFKHIVKEALPLSDNSSYLAFSKTFYAQHPSLAHSFWQHIEHLTSHDSYSRLIKKYKFN
nr:transporter substrate-binding domain-containing protein [Vibrio galatheae]